MNTQTDYAIAELARLIENLLRFGTVEELDAENARVRIKIGDLLTDFIPWLTQRAGDDSTWWCPSQGEQVLVLSPSGDLSQAVCLPAIYSDAKPANSMNPNKHKTTYSDGAVLEYDKESHVLTVSLPEGGVVNVIADFNVDGNITSTGDITDKKRSMQGDRDIYNQHNHADPQGGSVSPTTQFQ
jgi:phage baseplate assembly protein V